MKKSQDTMIVKVPKEVIAHMLGFVADPISLCRSACTSKIFSETVTLNDDLWDRLFRKRWTYLTFRSKGPLYSLEDYQERHLQDCQAFDRLVYISRAIGRECDYALGRKYENPLWVLMTTEFFSFDMLCVVAKGDDECISTLYGGSRMSALTQCVAALRLELVHFQFIQDALTCLIHPTTFDKDDQWKLEQCALVLAKSLWKWGRPHRPYQRCSDKSYFADLG